jgi:hypothetical protein
LDTSNAVRAFLKTAQGELNHSSWRIGIASEVEHCSRKIGNSSRHQVWKVSSMAADSLAAHYEKLGVVRLDTIPYKFLPDEVYLYLFLEEE